MDPVTALQDDATLFQQFLVLHKSQLETSGVPAHLWEALWKKLHKQIFDAGDTFSLLKIEYDERKELEPLWKVIVSVEKGVSKDNPEHIYLIDHAWTYQVNCAKQHLREVPGLLDRMVALMAVTNYEDFSSEELVDKVFNEMWKYNQTYSLSLMSSVGEQLPLWYIMDEFGSAIQHSDFPTFRIIPFIHIPDQVTYSLLFPIKNLVQGDEVTRDYVEGCIQDCESREAMLVPWKPKSFLNQSFEQSDADNSYFLEGHVAETLPKSSLIMDIKEKLKVYSEYSFVNSYLTHPKFEIVDSEEVADILWYTKHFKNFEELSEFYPHKYVNQFPFEHVLTVKDLLSVVCRRQVDNRPKESPETLETYPLWLPTTYNLKTELPKFVSYFQHREENGLDNHWICKPFNLARGMDTHITNNLNYILRLPFTGPKIAQKYIDNPVLFHRPEIGAVKFDIRYVILLKSVSPLEVYVYKNFFLRFSNYPFALKDFDDYEKHFTVMNYSENANLCRMLCDEFIEKFECQNNANWSDVEDSICKMLYETFTSATSRDPPAGIAPNPQSRAVYAVDLMLSWRNDNKGNTLIQPNLLEVNWCPDCQRACEYYPEFYNDIFGLLFFNQTHEGLFRLLA